MRRYLTLERLEARDLPSGSSGLAVARPPAGAVEYVRAINPTAASSAAQRWDRLLPGTWYVPAGNLLAYLVGPAAANPVPISDQTVFHITYARNGVFSGENVVRLSRPTALGWQGPEPMRFHMTGVVTPQGRIRITFTPAAGGQPPVTGVGNMQFVAGVWRMAMQMSTGQAPYVIHWAYMTKLTPGLRPAPVREIRSEEWRWLVGTRWALGDTELFASAGEAEQGSGVGVFRIEGYRNGYFWGRSDGPPPFSVVGSVTPEGNLFLVLTGPSGESFTRTGTLARAPGGRWVMHFRSYEGAPAIGVALALGGRGVPWWQ